MSHKLFNLVFETKAQNIITETFLDFQIHGHLKL